MAFADAGKSAGFADQLTFVLRLSTISSVEAEIDPQPGCGGDADDVVDYVRRAQLGDAEGYRQLFRRHVHRIRRVAYRLAGPGADLDDLVQTIFFEAFRALPGFRGDASFYTWLVRIALRVTSHHRRRIAQGRAAVDETTLRDEAPSLERVSQARRALFRFDAILATLSEKRRTAFVLHVLEGHSLEEVAALVGANLSAVKVRVHDARLAIERQARRDPYLADYLQWEKP